MAFDIPDGPRPILTIEVVGTAPVTPEAATEVAAGDVDYLSTSSLTYVTVSSWTVDTDKVGILRFVELESDNYSKTRWQLTIAGSVFFTHLQIISSLSMEFPDVRLTEAQVVLLEAKSSDGTAINVNGDIIGKEVG